MPRVQIFLSTVSAEFGSYRDALRRDLTRPNVSVAVQENFIATGTKTLDSWTCWTTTSGSATR